MHNYFWEIFNRLMYEIITLNGVPAVFARLETRKVMEYIMLPG